MSRQAMAEAAALNSRIGRVWPTALGSEPDRAGARIRGRICWKWLARSVGAGSAGTRHADIRRKVLPVDVPAAVLAVLLLLAALWPHWVWLARRLTDGSDEPWGILALVTVLVLVWRARGELQLPGRAALLASGGLAVVAAVLTAWVPPIFAAATAMLAVAVFITAALPRRPAAPLAALLLLALPVIASLQFYLGYPLRLATAHAAAPMLGLVGIEAAASGAALLHDGGTILVDPPCAGIGMLWVGSWAAALLSYLNEATPRRAFTNACVAAVAVFAANVLRNALLFFPEAGLAPQHAWLHAGIGLAAFAAALLPIAAFANRGGATIAKPHVPALHLDAAASRSLARGTFFVGACLAAAVLPPLATRFTASGAVDRDAAAAVGTRSVSVEWPTHFRGQPLTQLPPTALESRFAARFPGAVARFTDGEQLLILRRVAQPTRLLHPASDCFRGAGYTLGGAASSIDDDGRRWRCFVARRDGERLRVCERIVESLGDDNGRSWTDVSAWFWDAQWRSGHWWALTVVTPLAPGAAL